MATLGRLVHRVGVKVQMEQQPWTVSRIDPDLRLTELSLSLSQILLQIWQTGSFSFNCFAYMSRHFGDYGFSFVLFFSYETPRLR